MHDTRGRASQRCGGRKISRWDSRGADRDSRTITPPGAGAGFVIAAHENPRRGGQEVGGGLEEIGVPCLPDVAGRTARAELVGRALLFATEIVADVDDELRLLGGGARGDSFEGPLRGIVAILNAEALDPASGIAEDDDAGRVGRRQYEELPVHRCGFGCCGDDRFAGGAQALRHGLAQRHGQRRAVGEQEGQSAADVMMTRAMATPSGPISTQAESVAAPRYRRTGRNARNRMVQCSVQGRRLPSLRKLEIAGLKIQDLLNERRVSGSLDPGAAGA